MARWLLAVVLVAGCFSESTAPSGEGGSTGALPCPAGTRGCPCDGTACDAGLACHGPSHMCYEPDCERGALECPCADGLCLAGLACVDEFCTQPSTSGGSTSTSSPDPTGVSASLSATDPSSASETSTGTAQDTSATDPDTSSTSGPTDDPCLLCLKETALCPCNDSCQAVASCMYAGTDPGSCCANGPPGHADDWDAFVGCALSEGCAGVCGDPPDCGNGG